jgi:hypothetical protein
MSAWTALVVTCETDADVIAFAAWLTRNVPDSFNAEWKFVDAEVVR